MSTIYTIIEIVEHTYFCRNPRSSFRMHLLQLAEHDVGLRLHCSYRGVGFSKSSESVAMLLIGSCSSVVNSCFKYHNA